MAYPIEIAAPDIRAHAAGNTAIDYAWRFDSDSPGQDVLVTAIVHGNELSGAIVMDEALRAGLRPRRGSLTLAFCNVAAFERFDPAEPTATRFVDEDFNRVWLPARLDSADRSVELDRAREIRPLVDKADLLLDLHSMQAPSLPLMMAGPLAKGRRLAAAVGVPQHVVTDSGHANGRRMRDYGGFADPDAPQNALLLEAGQHWAASAVSVAREGFYRFLVVAGTIDPGDSPIDLPERPPIIPLEVTEAVTCKTDDFVFARDFEGMECLSKGTPIGTDGGTPVVAPYDNCYLVMPSRRLSTGLTAVRLARPVAEVA